MEVTVLLVATRDSLLMAGDSDRPSASSSHRRTRQRDFAALHSASAAHTRSRRQFFRQLRDELSSLLMMSAAACGSADLSTRVANPSAPSLESGTLPAVRSDSFIFGVNGHPLVQAAYSVDGRTVGEQFDYLDSLRVRWYRKDVRPDSEGALDPKFSEFMQAAASRGIHVLPIIATRPHSGQSPAAAYAEAFRIGEGFARRYGQLFTHVEAGNELEIWPLRSGSGGAADGSDLSQYDADTLAVVTAYLRGLTRGLRAGAPSLEIIVNAAGSHHWAFFDALQRDSVDYDIVGYHWYSNMGEINDPVAQGESTLGHLYDLNKDIWITEVNRTSTMPDDPHDQSYWIDKYVRDFYGFDRVKALFVYELYEERAFLADTNPSNDTEAFYGLVACPTDPVQCTGAKVLKPAFGAYRFGVEEQLHGHEDYVASLHVHLLGRAPDAGELAHWTNVFRSTNDRGALLRELMPASDYHEHLVRGLYDQLLGHDFQHGSAPGSSDVAYWVDRMRAGLSRQQLAVELCGSPGFWALSGRTNTGYVQRLYHTLLQRNAGPDDVSYWADQLNSGMTREEVAARFVDGDEYHGLFVDEQYRALLDRPSDGAGRAYWVEQMRNGMSEEEVILGILKSAEFWEAAVRAGYGVGEVGWGR